ncbi:MAG TPA: thioredoxin-disulfide reductase [Clostridiales bacterium]|nr:thioredoxin-disulfide reductase [Clostridiales bacterium]
MSKIYDVLIIGAGPAGLSAGIYAGRARLQTLIVEKLREGGQIVNTEEIENYPGCVEGDSGLTLIERMSRQAERFGVEKAYDDIVEVDLSGEVKKVKGTKEEYQAKTVIIATGASPRPIGCPGEKEFVGKGVSYCATCDGPFFEGLEVYVVGGGDAAVEEALFLTKFARKVTIIHRRDQLRAAKVIQEKAMANEKIHFIWNSVVEEIKGEGGILNEILLKDVKTGEIKSIKADEGDMTFGVFGFVGYVPQTEIFKGQIEMENGYIITDENMQTNIPGVFAAGDVRAKSLRQVVTAVADGAIAAVQAEKYLESKGK